MGLPALPGKHTAESEKPLPPSEVKVERQLQEIDLALDRARERRAAYRAAGKLHDAEIQDAVIDRRLRERFEVMGG